MNYEQYTMEHHKVQVLCLMLFNIMLHDINHNFPEHMDSLVYTDDIIIWAAHEDPFVAVDPV